MAEEFEKFKRFEYRMNSNLVLQREGPGPSQNEPTGEPESLVGRLMYKMGDMVQYEGTEALRKKFVKPTTAASTVQRAPLWDAKKKGETVKGSTVLDLDVTESFQYKPTTSQTRLVYQSILSALQLHIGDPSPDTLKGAADEILAALKLENVKIDEMKKNCEEVIGPIDQDFFTKLFRLSKQINDFSQGIEGQESTHQEKRVDLDDTAGVAVVFDEEDEAGIDEGMYEIDEDMEADDDEGIPDEERDQHFLAAKHIEDEDEELAAEKDKFNLDIAKIDPHWLQRELNTILGDPNLAVATEKEILTILPIPNIQECENKLVFILKYENFDFAKLVLKNRWKILYCTRLGQAQSSEEKAAIYEEMKGSDEGNEVLEHLETVKLRVNKEKQLTRNVRKEAATLAAKAQQSEKDHGSQDKDEYAIGVQLDDTIDLQQQKKPTQYIDFESISFSDGGHFMSNTKVKLPEGSQRVSFKGYDEVTVQPYKKPKDTIEEKIYISTLPEWTHAAFSSAGVDKLNVIQSIVFDVAFNKPEENMLVCAPTGAGKTNIAMLAILSTISMFRNSAGVIDTSAFKIVYISPMKALVAEQVQSFSQRLNSYGIKIREMTGDISLSRQQIEDTQILVTTPEKWDIITRKSGDRTYTQLVRLIILDEIHLLHDNRGPVIESIVARAIRQMESTHESIRLLGLSATLPNYEDVAMFLQVKMDKGLFYFGNHYRPVPLLQTYIGVKDKKAIKRHNMMNQLTYEKVIENAGKNQVLVFVHSRKESIKTARMIRDLALQNDTLAKFLQEDSASREILQSESEAIKTAELKDLLPYGFGVHHAGLPRTDRRLIEDLFADRHIQVLISTATLAWGVNLPAHTVIIKGTQVYLPEKGCWCELSPMDVMQMMGRGGRPQYDVSGHGIIITAHSELQYYLSLNNQQLPVESQMLSMLPDILNAEIVLGSIRSRQDASNWICYTYLFVRMLKNPELYGVSPDQLEADPTLEQTRVDLAHSALTLLDKHGLVRYDKRSGGCQVTALGRVASYYYIKHPTISVFNDHLKPTMLDIEIMRLFSLAHEFKYIPVREEEKAELVKLMDRVPIPVKGSADETSSKVNVLLQTYISKLKLEGFALVSDMVYVEQSAGRIMRSIFEICLRRGWATMTRRTLDFCKMIDGRMWYSMTPLRQFKILPEELLRKIEKKDFPWEQYYDLTSVEIGELVRIPKMGKTLHRLIHQFPKVELAAYVQPLTRTCLLIDLTITPDFQWDHKIHGSAEPFWVFVEDVDSEIILHHELFILKPFTGEEEHTLSFTVPITEPLPPNYFIRVTSDRWLHCEETLAVSFKNLILPEKNPPHTELLDLQPLPVTALRFPEAEALYSISISAFNPIQTQVFSTLYSTNENALICSPPASGKTVCAEFCILRMLRHESIRRAVYVAPYESTAKERYQQWSYKFGKLLGLKVNELCGDLMTDLKTLENSNLVITTAKKWDFISRRWKNRKVLQNIRLFIVDELQLLDSEIGPILEVCVFRMRYISAQLQNPIRIVGFGCSLSNAKDVGEWLGSSTTGLFNFHPNVRTVPLEISVNGFDLYHRGSRLLAMSKPVYQAIKHHSPNKPVIVFVPDRKQARTTCVDLLLQLSNEKNPKAFLHTSDNLLEEEMHQVREKMLRESLKYGIGYIHQGFCEADKRLVEKLFQSGAIQVLIAVEELAWGMSLSGYLVIIMDTKRFTPTGYIDYPLQDMLQMIGRATRPNIDKNGVVVLFCHSAKKEHYKKFIFEPLSVESRLDQRLTDFINAEVVLKTIENEQDAIDWLTWSFYYRRLSKNPNYYGLQGMTHQHLSDHLSEQIESSIEALEQAQCLTLDGVSLQPSNLGLISTFYYIRYTTIESFNQSITSNSRRKGILEIISAAAEFDTVPIRDGEENVLKALAMSIDNKLYAAQNLTDPHYKALILLYSHFNRSSISLDLASDQQDIVETSLRLVHGIVDVISSNGWLQPALISMELSQMVVQALNGSQSTLKQLPHFTDDLVAQANNMKIQDVFDLMNMEDDERNTLMKGLTESQMMDVAKACNRYPVINLTYSLSKETAHPGESIRCTITLERDLAGEEYLGPIYSIYYPKEKDEQWWVVIGQSESNALVAIKRLSINKETATINLDFEAPEETGAASYTLYLLSDCYMGCDQEYPLQINVSEPIQN